MLCSLQSALLGNAYNTRAWEARQRYHPRPGAKRKELSVGRPELQLWLRSAQFNTGGSDATTSVLGAGTSPSRKAARAPRTPELPLLPLQMLMFFVVKQVVSTLVSRAPRYLFTEIETESSRSCHYLKIIPFALEIEPELWKRLHGRILLWGSTLRKQGGSHMKQDCLQSGLAGTLCITSPSPTSGCKFTAPCHGPVRSVAAVLSGSHSPQSSSFPGPRFPKLPRAVVVSQGCLLHTSYISLNFVFNSHTNVFADLNTSSPEPASGFYLGKTRGFSKLRS